MKTVYKVLTPSLQSVASYFPSFPKELVLQYEPGNWTCGRENSKLFCFESLQDAIDWITPLKEKKWFVDQQFDIWECQAVNVRARTRVVSFRSSNRDIFMELFRKLWNNSYSGTISKKRINRYTERKISCAEKICLVKRVCVL